MSKITNEAINSDYMDTLALNVAKDIMSDLNRRSDFLGGDVQLLSRIQCRINEALKKVVSSVDVEEKAEIQRKLDALMVENISMKDSIIDHSNSVNECHCGRVDDCSNDDVCRVLNTTPETDAARAGILADGVEMFVPYMHSDVTESEALEFARKLRNGEIQ